MKYSKEDIFRMVEEEDVEFIRLQFTDIFGVLKNMAVTVSQLEKILDNQCMFCLLYTSFWAKSPEPPSLQKMHPPYPMVPSRLGQDIPPSKASLYSFSPNCSLTE